MKNTFISNSFGAPRNLAFSDKVLEASRHRKGARDFSVSFDYEHGAPSYPEDVLTDCTKICFWEPYDDGIPWSEQSFTISASGSVDDRAELTAATIGGKAFAYDYDNIGNRKTAQEEADEFTYTANALNRPITYTRENEDGTLTVITADYDYMGRRVYKKVETVTPAAPETENGEETRTILTNHRYLYRGYLQIAALDLTRTTLNALWYITWDPTEPIATRPLAIQKDGTWYTYGLDLPKNITEVYGTNGGIKTAYTYTPYGLVTSSGNTTQPIQWSSEYADTDLGLVYYNYRHYNPLDGRWTGRDPIGISGGYNLCTFSNNSPAHNIDNQGLNICCDQCKDLGVTEATIRLKITSQHGDPDIVDGVNQFSKLFDYGAKGAKRIFKPLSIASDLYTESVNSASRFFTNRSQARKDGLWVVHGKMEYSVCSVESCLLIFKRKTLSKKDTGWVSSAAILPNDYADAVREVEKKLKKMLKNVN